MSQQICPECGQKKITWSIDEEVSPFTLWFCWACKYSAEEDEKREGDCPRCGSKWCSLVKDEDGFHRWCTTCGLFESTTETFGD